MPGSFGQQQCTQGIWIGRECVDVRNHALDSTRRTAITKVDGVAEAAASQPAAGYSTAVGARTSTSRTRVQSSPSIRAESCAGVRRIIASSIFGQRNVPSSSRLAMRQEKSVRSVPHGAKSKVELG